MLLFFVLFFAEDEDFEVKVLCGVEWFLGVSGFGDYWSVFIFSFERPGNLYCDKYILIDIWGLDGWNMFGLIFHEILIG